MFIYFHQNIISTSAGNVCPLFSFNPYIILPINVRLPYAEAATGVACPLIPLTLALFSSSRSLDTEARCSLSNLSSASFCPTASSPDWIPEWYTRRMVSTSSSDCVRTSASSLILAVTSLIYLRYISVRISDSNKLYGRLTWSSVRVSRSCSTRDLTAFQPVRRCL